MGTQAIEEITRVGNSAISYNDGRNTITKLDWDWDGANPICENRIEKVKVG